MESKSLSKLFILLGKISNTKLKKILVIFGIGVLISVLRSRICVRSNMNSLFGSSSSTIPKERNKLKGKVDLKFWKKLLKILKISFPKVLGRETLVIFLLSFALMFRTLLSIEISDLNGRIVKAIVKMDLAGFIYRLFVLSFYSLPSSVTNSSLDLLNKLLGLYLRENLTKYFHEKYLQNKCFYQITNLDTRLTNPDQIFTNDIEKWSYSLSNLYSNFSKPLLDIFLFSRKISKHLGYKSPLITICWYVFAAFLMKYFSPHVGQLIVTEQNLEGEFRACHTGIITHSEEIAFYKGNKWEEKRMNDIFNDLTSHIDLIYSKRFLIAIFESLVLKYGSVIIGFCLLAEPVFKNIKFDTNLTDVATKTKDYISNSQNLINLSKAIGRIFGSYKDIQRLAGYTFLVNKLDKVIDDINKGKYVRIQVAEADLNDEKYVGQYIISDNIEFQDVPIITPNRDSLIKRISFKIDKGHHTIITGPNGCGKSSLFRILGKLWPLHGGVVKKPHYNELFYIPQRPYLPYGTLRDQIIYPMSYSDFINSGKTDQDILLLFEKVYLNNILQRFNTKLLDTYRDWNDVLSGGEKQRIAMARLFFHNPKYAILDECTSACSIEIEGKMYIYAKSMGITLITISHRPSLWKHHITCIRFLGDGEVAIEEIRTLISNSSSSN